MTGITGIDMLRASLEERSRPGGTVGRRAA